MKMGQIRWKLSRFFGELDVAILRLTVATVSYVLSAEHVWREWFYQYRERVWKSEQRHPSFDDFIHKVVTQEMSKRWRIVLVIVYMSIAMFAVTLVPAWGWLALGAMAAFAFKLFKMTDARLKEGE